MQTNPEKWAFPLNACNGIPVGYHPGAFGFVRNKDIHTGVDLYTVDGAEVCAVEDGIVVNIDIFTGPKLGHYWWEETWGVMVEGLTGVVNYGEITPDSSIKIGTKVCKNQKIGNIKRVLFENRLRLDIPGHSTSMLHIELYKHGTRDFFEWHEFQENTDLLDPTLYLIASEKSPCKTLTWKDSSEKFIS